MNESNEPMMSERGGKLPPDHPFWQLPTEPVGRAARPQPNSYATGKAVVPVFIGVLLANLTTAVIWVIANYILTH